jgi:hypothetical protein
MKWLRVVPLLIAIAGAYGERVGSDFGIAMVTTTRYALAEAFREDTCATAASARACFGGWVMP